MGGVHVRITCKKKSYFFSIDQSKTFLINFTLLLGVGFYSFYENVSANRLTTLENAATENLLSAIDLLMLRRHEKDYFARRNEQYIEIFDKTYQQLQSRLSDLAKTLSAEFLSTNIFLVLYTKFTMNKKVRVV